MSVFVIKDLIPFAEVLSRKYPATVYEYADKFLIVIQNSTRSVNYAGFIVDKEVAQDYIMNFLPEDSLHEIKGVDVVNLRVAGYHKYTAQMVKGYYPEMYFK